MLKITLTGSANVMRHLGKQKDAFMTRVAEDVKKVAQSFTPIDKGRARRGWKMRNQVSVTQSSSSTRSITNRVPYIDLLERGRSKQAPKGIIGPTVREIKRRRYR
tara:strand:- start:1202 stop:1516 length:315 start_codon:yes stop_codon:yes gene_type:complete